MLNTMVITEKNDIMRTGLRAAIEEAGIAEVIGDYASEYEMMRDLSRLQPDVVVFGGNRSIFDRCRACQDVREVSPNTRILTFTERQRDDEMRELILAGVSGCVVTSAGSAEIIRSVAVVANGGMSFDKDAVSRLMKRAPKQPYGDAAFDGLTEREHMIMTLVAQDYTNEEIGQRLNLSKFTVRNSITDMRGKLNIKSKIGLAVFAVQHGLLDIPGIIPGNEDAFR